MSDNDVAAEHGPEVPALGSQSPGAGHRKSPEPFMPPGPVSTKKLRERARRRREAEEKLQQHLLAVKEKPAGEYAPDR